MLDVNWELSRIDSRGDRRYRVGRREVATPAKVSVVPFWGPELVQIIQNWGEWSRSQHPTGQSVDAAPHGDRLASSS